MKKKIYELELWQKKELKKQMKRNKRQIKQIHNVLKKSYTVPNTEEKHK